MSTSRPAAGWYRDPSGRYEHRWWSGTEWTPHVMTLGMRSTDDGREAAAVSPAEADPVRPATPQPEEEEEAAASGPRRWPVVVWVLALAGAGLLVLGAVLPWAEAESATTSFSADGIDGNGAITIVTAVVIVLSLVVVQRRTLAAGLVIGTAAIAGAVGVHDAIDISRKADNLMDHGTPGVSAGVGIGVWVTLVAAAIALVGGMIALAVALRKR
jgi:hypothetical protein